MINLPMSLMDLGRYDQAIDLLKRTLPFNRIDLNSGSKHRLSTYIIDDFEDATPVIQNKYREFLRVMYLHPCSLYKEEQVELEEILEQPIIDVVFPEGWLRDPEFDPNMRYTDYSRFMFLRCNYPDIKFALKLTTHPEFSVEKSSIWVGVHHLKSMTKAGAKKYVTRLIQCGLTCSAKDVKEYTAMGIDVFQATQKAISSQRDRVADCEKSIRQMKERETKEDDRYQLLIQRLDQSEERQLKLLQVNQILFQQIQMMSQGWHQAQQTLATHGLEIPELPALADLPQ